MDYTKHKYQCIIQSLRELGYYETWQELVRAKRYGLITQHEYELIVSVLNTRKVGEIA